MKWNSFYYSLLLLFLSVLCSPAPTVNFSSPPFNPNQFTVNQAANDISIKNSSNTVPIGVYPVKIRFQTGTNYFSIDSASVPDGYALLSTNGTVAYFPNSGGGGGTSTNLLPLNNTWTGTNTWSANTNEFSFALHAGSLYVGSGLFSVNTAGNLRANSIIDAGSFSADAGQFFSDGIGNVTAMSFSGIGTSLTALNASQLTSGTVSVGRLPVATTSTLGILRPDNTTITISGGIITAVGSSSTITNISGGVGISITQAGGTNFVAITGLVVTNAIYTNAGPNFTLNNTLVLNTNGFGGGGGSSVTNYVLNFGGSGTNETFWGTFVMTNFATGNGITFDGTSFLLSGINLNTVGAGSIGGNGAGLINLNGSGINNGTVNTAFLQSNVLTNLVGTSASAPSVSGHTGLIPTNFSSSVSSGVTYGRFVNTNWSAATVAVGTGVAIASTADFDTNGTLDFVLPRNSAIFQVYTNSGVNGFYGTFALAFSGTASGIVLGCCTADVNRDGRPDIIVVSASAIDVFTNSGATAQFVKLGSSYPIVNGFTPYAADFNGDGIVDFVASSSSTSGAEYTNNGTGIFTTNSANALPAFARGSHEGVIGHFAGNTNWDFAIQISSGLLLLTNNGLGVFSVASTNIDITAVGALSTNDFNLDGKTDIVLDSAGTGKLYVFTNNGNAAFGDYSTNNVPGNGGATYQASSGDVNNDGLIDIVSGQSASGGYVVLTNSGIGLGFSTFTTNGPSTTPILPFVGDFNNDGRPDVGWYGLGTSAANYSVVVTYNLPFFNGLSSGFFNGDGSQITNGNLSVSFSSSAVTPAASFTASASSFGSLSVNTNYYGPVTTLGFNVLAETGVTAGTAATTGKFGEVVQSLIAVGSAVSIATTATPVNITSISLTAGDWDVYANANIKGNTTANYNSALACINTVSATMVTDGSEVPSAVTASTFSANDGIPITCKQINVSATTTVYLVVQATFTANAPSGYGKLFARRVSR